METKPTRRVRTQMINEHKEFLEYTTEYTEGQKGGSSWGRLPNDSIYDGIGLGRALTIIARGFLYHEFDENGNISVFYEKENITPEHCKKAESYLMYWLTGDETYINSLPEKSLFRPYSFKQYLKDVEADSKAKQNPDNGDKNTDSDAKLEKKKTNVSANNEDAPVSVNPKSDVNAGVEVNNNKTGYKKDEEKIKQYIDDKHQEKVNELLKLIKNYSCEYIVEEPVESEGREDEKLEKEQIISILDTLLKKGTKKAEADREDFEKLKNFFNCENPEIKNNYDSNYKLLKELIVKHKVTYVKKNDEKNIILKTINALSKKIPDDKSEDRVKVKSLSDYFVSNEEKTGLHYHLYNRFFFCTQYSDPITYGKNFNFKSVIVTALHEGPFSTNGCFSVDKKNLNIIIKAMESEKGRQAPQFIWQWVVFIFVAAYCKSRSYQTEDSFTYHPYVLSTLDSWPKRDGKGFTDLFNKKYKCDQYGEKLLICSLKQKYFGKDFIKIAVNKEILDGIKFVKEGTADTEDYIVLRDCGINSYNESVAKFNDFYSKHKKMVAKEKKFLALISKLKKNTKTSFFETCEHDLNQLSQNICKNVNKITEKNKNQKGIRKNVVTAVKCFEQMKRLKADAESNYVNLIKIQNTGSSMEIREKATQLKNSIQDSYENILQIFNNSLKIIEKSISLIGDTYGNLLEESKKKA